MTSVEIWAWIHIIWLVAMIVFLPFLLFVIDRPNGGPHD